MEITIDLDQISIACVIKLRKKFAMLLLKCIERDFFCRNCEILQPFI